MDLLKRLSEPSSWASIAAALAAVGFTMPDSTWKAIVQLGMGASAIAGIVISEKGGA